MRVLLVSWEYPPVVVGGLGRHVHALARELTTAGHEVVVLCRQPTGSDAATHPTTDSLEAGVRILRAAEDPIHLEFARDLVAWTLAMGHTLVRTALTRLDGWRPDVVHAHDWLVAHPATTLADVLGVPLVATIHATEAGRHSGWLPGPLNRAVHSVEWALAKRADAVITCSRAMRAEVARLFDVEGAHVVHNGIDTRGWRVRRDRAAVVRERYAPGDGPVLAFVGRLEYEKGVQDLLAALPRIRRRHPGTRLLVAGTGTQREFLGDEVRRLRLGRAVTFTGHLPDRDLAALLVAADAVVLPSRYEPFGIVALEAAAAGATLVASTAGGLGELVIEGETGWSFPPGDVPALAAAVTRALEAPAADLVRRARGRLREHFTWAGIAARTAAVYAAARTGGPVVLARPKIATGNLLAEVNISHVPEGSSGG
jgi:glycogen synthase